MWLMTEVQTAWVAALPARMRASIEREDAKERLAARAEELERKARAEDWQQANLALAAEQASLRGEVVGAMQLARGEVTGRSVGDVLAGAARAGEAQDAREQARATRGADGGRAECFVGEANIIHGPARRSGLALQLYNRGEAFFHRVRARRAAEAARERELNVLPLSQAVQITRRGEW
jgi:hypothetical protein